MKLHSIEDCNNKSSTVHMMTTDNDMRTMKLSSASNLLISGDSLKVFSARHA